MGGVEVGAEVVVVVGEGSAPRCLRLPLRCAEPLMVSIDHLQVHRCLMSHHEYRFPLRCRCSISTYPYNCMPPITISSSIYVPLRLVLLSRVIFASGSLCVYFRGRGLFFSSLSYLATRTFCLFRLTVFFCFPSFALSFRFVPSDHGRLGRRWQEGKEGQEALTESPACLRACTPQILLLRCAGAIRNGAVELC